VKPQSILRKLIILLAVCFVCTARSPEKGGAFMENPRERLLMDFNWRFHLGHICEQQQDFDFGAAGMFAKIITPLKVLKADFNDSDWQKINLPHDWVVELPFDPNTEMSHGFKPTGRAFPANTIGWYRKSFDIPVDELGRRVSLEFDGVFRDCFVWLNGFLLGRNQSGYNSFRYDITDYVNYGGKNVLVLRVDITHQEGWFYEGGGIYRHVWLVKTNPVHVAHWGTFVTSDMKHADATVTAQTKIVNESNEKTLIELESRIEDANGKIVAKKVIAGRTIEPWNQCELPCKITIKGAKLWSLQSPYLYKLISIIKQNGKLLDRYETQFGVRTIRFDPDNGFFLNGKRIFIKGTCNHQDHAGAGSALPDHLQYYRIERLKEMGCNAYRTSHNAPTPELLEACDRLGMLVLDETRTMGSSAEVLGQLESMVLRDRNHPCIIIWSLGNEEWGIQGNAYGQHIGKTMLRTVKNLDSTRPVTMAMNGGFGKGMSNVVDIQGFNYNHGALDEFRKDHPKMPIIMTEDASTLCARGIYQTDESKGYLSAYDDNSPRWGYTAMDCLKFYAQRPWIMGTFIWTGFDYRGEPTPYRWPCINSHFGIMDTCGYPKDNFFYYQAWWSDKTVLHILPHWNWAGKEGQDIDVRCLTNCSQVELFLNGKSLGRQSVAEYGDARWMVRYEPGTLAAKGYKDGKQIAQAKVETAGAPASISLIPDCASINADGEDVTMVQVEIRDAQDRICPPADNLVRFEISENGQILGVGNGDPSSHESDKAPQRKAFNGTCQVIIQAKKTPGDIKLTAQSDGLPPRPV
jgi:beta-galactosidase